MTLTSVQEMQNFATMVSAETRLALMNVTAGRDSPETIATMTSMSVFRYLVKTEEAVATS